MNRHSICRAFLLLLAAALTLTAARDAAAQRLAQPQPRPVGQSTEEADHPHAWTLESALDQLRLYPRDPYLQYVVLQMHHRGGDAFDAANRLRSTLNRNRRSNPNVRNVDLFSIFSGALAVQESLQLDAMTDTNVDENRASAGSISQLVGPTVKSHPWTEMLAGRQPAVSPLTQCVPSDYLFVQFRSAGDFLRAMELADHWGAYVVSQTRQEARTLSVTARMKRQLAIEVSDLLRPVYDAVLDRIAITSSDLYFREGTDVTLIMQLKQPQLFQLQMDKFLSAAERNEAGAVRSRGVVHGVPFVHVTTPERTVHVYSAYPRPDLHVRSNSRAAFERVLAAIQGDKAEGTVVERLGDTDEFKFIRTIMAEGADEEDGFVYMSDPFIRRLVGAQAKLTHRRRLLCYNHLRMIGHASLLYMTEQGKLPQSLQELTAARCLPEDFGSQHLICRDGGRYSLGADGLTGVCTHHGRANSLKPCCEIPVSDITETEAQEYRQFVDRYNAFWRTFFDPIAIRFQMTPERYRVETVVLPLIDNSIYTNLAMALGGEPEPLDGFPLPKRNIFTMAVKLDKARLLQQFGAAEMLAPAEETPDVEVTPESSARRNAFYAIGLAMHNYHDTFNRFPPVTPAGRAPSGLSWRVHLLPFLDHAELYNEFHLDEPWDSEHNRKLISRLPSIYRSTNAQLSAQGKTTIVRPHGPQLISNNNAQGTRISEILDGTSNTILVSEADDEHAVIWTKPDDLSVDLSRPSQGWRRSAQNTYTLLMADGSVVELPAGTSAAELSKLLTRAGGEVTMDLSRFRPDFASQRRRGIEWEFAQRFHLAAFLQRGIGQQISLNICDADPLVDFNVSRFMGMMTGAFRGRGGFNVFDGEGVIALLALSLNVPIYVAIPVNDADVVDKSLEGLDLFLASIARQDVGGLGDFFEIQQDFYQFARDGESPVRSYAFRFGPLTWRFFWARIGQGLYIASKPFIIEDLLALEEAQRNNPQAGLEHSAGPPAHGLVRIRAEHWDRVLTQYRIGWAENQRLACLHNVGPLSSLSRAVHAAPAAHGSREAQLEELTFRVFDSHFYCPANGKYVLSPDGHSVHCSVHGTALAPRQPTEPGIDTRLGALLGELKEVSLALTFLEDGLHAVVTIDKKPKADQ